jgi:hypothetical protein
VVEEDKDVEMKESKSGRKVVARQVSNVESDALEEVKETSKK